MQPNYLASYPESSAHTPDRTFTVGTGSVSWLSTGGADGVGNVAAGPNVASPLVCDRDQTCVIRRPGHHDRRRRPRHVLHDPDDVRGTPPAAPGLIIGAADVGDHSVTAHWTPLAAGAASGNGNIDKYTVPVHLRRPTPIARVRHVDQERHQRCPGPAGGHALTFNTST